MENYQCFEVAQKCDTGIYGNSLMTNSVNPDSGCVIREVSEPLNMFTQQNIDTRHTYTVTTNIQNVDLHPSMQNSLSEDYLPISSDHSLLETCHDHGKVTLTTLQDSSLNISDGETFDDVCSRTDRAKHLCEDNSMNFDDMDKKNVIEPEKNRLLSSQNFQPREATVSEKCNSVGDLSELFPFICGICYKKFMFVPEFFSHMEMHESISCILHYCDRTKDKISELFVCGVCGLKFPSLCSVYKHVVDVEKINDFVYKSDNNTINACEPETRNSSCDLCEHVDAKNYVSEIENKELVAERGCITTENCSKDRKESKIDSNQKVLRNIKDTVVESLDVNLYKDNSDENKCLSDDPFSKRQKQRTNMKNVLFPCEVCGGFYQYQNLKKHKTIHAERTYACDQCPNLYKSQFRLNAHKKQVHAEENKFTCDECGKCFKASQYLRQHRQVHVKECNIQCPQCPMKFRYKALLKTHMLTHSEDKPFQCDLCDRAFKQQHQLKFHKNGFHRNERAFACTECNKMFKTLKDLRQHHWVHLPPRYFCPVCDKGFIQKANMKLHIKIHGVS